MIEPHAEIERQSPQRPLILSVERGVQRGNLVVIGRD